MRNFPDRLLLTCSLILLALAGCGSRQQTPQPVTASAPPAAQDTANPPQWHPGLPPLPTAELPLSVLRQASADSVTVTGDGFSAQQGGNNHSPGGSSFAIIPGGDDELAWAQYNVGGLLDGKPVELSLLAAPASPPGGGAALPLEYWLGIANYTTFRWEWQGPFSGSRTLTLNSPELRDRYVSASGTMSYVVFVLRSAETSESNPQGLNGVRLVSSTTQTPSTYQPNRPHYTIGEAPSAGDSKNPASLRSSSAALAPGQYVTLRWQHVSAFNLQDTINEAFQYQVFRKGPLDNLPVNIGSVLAPETAYVDPLDNASSAPPPIPGASYEYFLRAINPTGFTPLAPLGSITIPLLPPTNLAASDGVFDDRIRLSWDKAAGASSYLIFRDGDPQPVAVVGNVNTWDDEDVADTEIHNYRLRSRNPFALSVQTPLEPGSRRALVQEFDLMLGDETLGPYILHTDAAFNPVTGAPLAAYTSNSGALLSDGMLHLYEFAEGSGWQESAPVGHSGILSPPGQPIVLAFAGDGSLGMLYGEVFGWTYNFALRPAAGGPLGDELISDAGVSGPIRLVWDSQSQNFACAYPFFDASNLLAVKTGTPGNFNQLPGTPVLADPAYAWNFDLCYDSAGDLHIAYCDGKASPLNLWYLIDGTWQTVTVDLDSPSCYGVNIAAAPNGDICILYQRASELRYARGRINRDNGSPEFSTERVLLGGFLGYLEPYTTDLAVDSQGQPHIVYPTDRLGNGERLWYRYRDAQGWSEAEEIDHNFDTWIEARYASIALSAEDRPLIVYARTYYHLRARWYR